MNREIPTCGYNRPLHWLLKKNKKRSRFTLLRSILTALISLSQSTQVRGADTSADVSTIAGLNSSGMAEVSQTITVQAVDINGDPQTTGGDTLELYIEQKCSYFGCSCVEDVDSDSVPGLPMLIPMTDNGDGTYEAPYMISAGSGTISASILIAQPDNGICGEYWDDPGWTGAPTITQVDTQLNFDWVTGSVTPLSVGDDVTTRWTGYIRAPTTGTYTFHLAADDDGAFSINGESVEADYQNNRSMTTDLTALEFYLFEASFYESRTLASYILEWESADSGLALQTVPSTAFHKAARISDTVQNVEIAPTSVPTESTIESATPATIVADNTVTVTLQSRDSAGAAHTGVNDVFVVRLVHSDGSIAQVTQTASHLGSGLFEANVSLTIAGTYTVYADLTNDYTDTDSSVPVQVSNLSGSPLTVTVEADTIDPAKIYTDIAIKPSSQAGDPFNYTIYFTDVYGNNVLAQTLSDELAAGMSVSVTATYDNDYEWRSPIGVPDSTFPYSTSISGTAADSNDGTMAGALAIITKAADYALSITVDGADVINSPHSFLRIVPAELNSANCVAIDVPTIIYAGIPSQFQIQTRDAYHNNLSTLLTDEVGTDYSVTISNSTVEVDAHVSDSPHLPGVYLVEVQLPIGFNEGNYNLDVLFGRLPVPVTPSILSVENWSALDSGSEEVNLPKFDLEDKNKDMLEMGKDEFDTQFFSPVFLVCISEWSQRFPSIEGEESGQNFSLSVHIDTAAAEVLSYDPISRRFTLHPPSEKFSVFVTTIKINLTDSKGQSSSYELLFSYRPCDSAEDSSDYVLRYDQNPPMPFIRSISQYGEVKVAFNETMQASLALADSDLNHQDGESQKIKNLRGRRLASFDRNTLLEGEVLSSQNHDFRNYSRIHNSTIQIEGKVYPAIDISLVPADPETTCSDLLDFNWEITDFSRGGELTIKLRFDSPFCISGSALEKDELRITFNDQRLFVGDSNKMILPGTVVTKKIRKQMASEGAERDMLELMQVVVVVAVASASISSIIFATALKGAVRKLLNAVKSLQIILHIMLLPVFFVASIENFIDTLQGLVFANLYGRDQIARMGHNNDTPLTAETTQESGQEGGDFVDVPTKVTPVTIFVVGAPIGVLLLYLSTRYCFCVKVRGFCKNQKEKTVFNRLYLFFDGSLLIFLVLSTITVYEARQDELQQIVNYGCSVIFIIFAVLFCFIIVAYLLFKFEKSRTDRVQDRIGAAYTSFKSQKAVYAFLLLSFVRRIALGFLVTLGRSHLTAQLLFVNYSSLVLISVIATVRPYLSRSQNVLEMANEFTILLLLCLFATQTEFVQDPKVRSSAAWSLNTLIILNFFGNLSLTMGRESFKLYRKIRLYFLKRQRRRDQENAAFRRKKYIENYRKMTLKTFAEDLARENQLAQSSHKRSNSLPIATTTTKITTGLRLDRSVGRSLSCNASVVASIEIESSAKKPLVENIMVQAVLIRDKGDGRPKQSADQVISAKTINQKLTWGLPPCFQKFSPLDDFNKIPQKKRKKLTKGEVRKTTLNSHPKMQTRKQSPVKVPSDSIDERGQPAQEQSFAHFLSQKKPILFANASKRQEEVMGVMGTVEETKEPQRTVPRYQPPAFNSWINRLSLQRPPGLIKPPYERPFY